jgi:hypothetical protein
MMKDDDTLAWMQVLNRKGSRVRLPLRVSDWYLSSARKVLGRRL